MLWFTVIFLITGFIFPIVDWFWDKSIKKDLHNHNKVKTYSLVMLYQWLIAGCIIIGFTSMNISLTELKFVRSALDVSALGGFTVGLMLNIIILFTVALFIPVGRKRVLAMFDAIEVLLPNGWKERLLFAALAVTAGFCEEVIYRGFMFYYLERLDWGLTPLTIAIITSIIFGLAHFYQGWKNVIFTMLVGFAMARLFISFESLWIPIIVHILIDLRFAVLPNVRKLLTKLNKLPA